MSAQRARAASGWTIGISLMFLASAASGTDPSVPPAAPAAADSSAAATSGRPTSRDRRTSVQERIEQRVRLMTKALDLSTDQQRQLRTILMEQLNQAQRIARDPAIAPDDRIGALRALNEHTREHIGAILDEGQQKKYGLPPPKKSAPAQGTR